MSTASADAAYPAIHLGWFTICLKAGHYEDTLGFYKKLGFKVVGGQPDSGWAVVANGATELAIMRFLTKNLITLRGADVLSLVAELERRGLATYHLGGTDPTNPEAPRQAGARAYDAAAWPAAFHTGKDGGPLPIAGAGDFMIDDPDGHTLYFDSVPVERARYDAGERFCTEGLSGEPDVGQPRLGRFVMQLKVKDLDAARAFYERLGLRAIKELPEVAYVEMSNGMPAPVTLGFNAKVAPADLLSFECQDLAAIAGAAAAEGLAFERPPSAHPDGAKTATLRDPEGNIVFFRQPPA